MGTAVAERTTSTARVSLGAFASPRARSRYVGLVAALGGLAVLVAVGYLTWDNPMPYGSKGFWRIAEMRSGSLLVIAIVAFSQAIATVSFQTVTTNRIITPSILGFEALYVAIQTAAVYLLGISGIVAVAGLGQFVLQVAVMVGFAVVLFSWLLSGRHANLQVMLLVGIVIGTGLGSVSAFMRRLLTPSEFDVLTARMFGSIANAEMAYLSLALPLAVGAGALLIARSRRLDVLALGRDTATSLGLDHRREVKIVLALVAVLVAVSTALVGPMTFFGFLVATLAYQFTPTHDHRYLLPVAALTAFVVLGGSYFVLKNVFYAQGVVSVIIELVGGSLFLLVILRKGRL